MEQSMHNKPLTDEIKPNNLEQPAANITEVQEDVTDEEISKPVKTKHSMRPKSIRKIRESLEGRDIRYRGPLSYRHLRVFGWLCIALAVCGMILAFSYKFVPNLKPIVGTIGQRLSGLWSFAVPMFMLANFAVILHARDGYPKLILRYAVPCVAILGVSLLFVYHYGFGIYAKILGGAPSQAKFDAFLHNFFRYGYLSFNIFVDLLLCTLLTFFLYFRPKKLCGKRRMILFRLLALLPIAYEIVCFVLKTAAALEHIQLPIWSWPLLTTKPPVVFVIFLSIALFIKRRERRFLASGFTHDEFRCFLRTNRNSLHFSVFTGTMFFIFSILDFVTALIMTGIVYVVKNEVQTDAAFQSVFDSINSTGIGNGLILLLFVPIIYLFSYTKTYKDRKFDIALPVFGVGLTVLAVLELLYQMFQMV